MGGEFSCYAYAKWPVHIFVNYYSDFGIPSIRTSPSPFITYLFQDEDHCCLCTHVEHYQAIQHPICEDNKPSHMCIVLLFHFFKSIHKLCSNILLRMVRLT